MSPNDQETNAEIVARQAAHIERLCAELGDARVSLLNKSTRIHELERILAAIEPAAVKMAEGYDSMEIETGDRPSASSVLIAFLRVLREAGAPC